MIAAGLSRHVAIKWRYTDSDGSLLLDRHRDTCMIKATVFRRILLGFAAALLAAASLPASARADARSAAGSVPDLASFAASVADGEAGVRGVYAEGLFALAVEQQPSDSYVSGAADTVTQFRAASQYGVV